MGKALGVELRRAGVAFAAVVVAALAVAPAAQAVQFDVTRFDDPPTNGCAVGDCSLREAVEDANATAAGDVVNLPAPPPGQAYQLDFDQIAILEDLTITGADAATTTVRSQGFRRVFEIGNFGTSAPEAEINNLTITNGRESPGGGIQVAQGQLVLRNSVVTGNIASGEGAGFGGGLAVRPGGLAVIENTTFSNNSAPGLGMEGGQGGAIWSDSPQTISISKSTIGPNNTAGGTLGPDPGGGGGISIQNAAGALSLLNVTISGNSVTGGVNGRGGGIFIDDGANAVLDSTTLAENTVAGAGGAGGNVAVAAGSALLRQTLVAGGAAASAGNCIGAVASGGRNLESPSSQCNLNAGGDQPSVANPLLEQLGDNGGPTLTHALLDGSPAIDTGAADCPQPDTDQRGVVRAQGPACDIGAYEMRQGSEIIDPETPDDLCFGRRATIIGDKGDNVVTGTSGDDVIVSLTGADVIRGLEGDDLICARGTEDVLEGGPGDDRLRADGEDDKLRGGPGDDVLNGANDDDKVNGNAGDDKLHGGDGNDDINGGKGEDSCWGNKGEHDHAHQCEQKEGIP